VIEGAVLEHEEHDVLDFRERVGHRQVRSRQVLGLEGHGRRPVPSSGGDDGEVGGG
jgi:hypothetical protein